MSVCSDCIKPKPVARCITNLILGTISSVNTAVYVFIKNLTTEREIRYSVTSSAAGLITIPITPQRFSEDHSYEAYVSKVSAPNINERETLTVDGEVGDCVALDFETIWKNDNTIATFTDQTLTV